MTNTLITSTEAKIMSKSDKSLEREVNPLMEVYNKYQNPETMDESANYTEEEIQRAVCKAYSISTEEQADEYELASMSPEELAESDRMLEDLDAQLARRRLAKEGPRW